MLGPKGVFAYWRFDFVWNHFGLKFILANNIHPNLLFIQTWVTRAATVQRNIFTSLKFCLSRTDKFNVSPCFVRHTKQICNPSFCFARGWIARTISSLVADQSARKALFTCVLYNNTWYLPLSKPKRFSALLRANFANFDQQIKQLCGAGYSFVCIY